MKRQALTLSLSLLFIAVTVVVVDAALVGGWKPLNNLNDEHVKEIAEFAVAEHNKQAKTDLKLESIIKGESQVVSGMNYRLVLAVKEGGAIKKYQAVVYEITWKKVKSLTSFEPFKG